MTFCCGEYLFADSIRHLFDNNIYESRKIEIFTCPKCGKKKAVLTQWRIKDGKLIIKHSKKGKIESFIKKYSKEPWQDGMKPPKIGTMANMGWVYLSGSDEAIKDFNDVKKEIDNICSKVKVFNGSQVC